MKKWGHILFSGNRPQRVVFLIFYLWCLSLILPSIVMAAGSYDGDIVFVSPQAGDVSGIITIDVNTCDGNGVQSVKLGIYDATGLNMGPMEDTEGPGLGFGTDPCGSDARTFRKVWDTRNVENGTYNFHAYACDLAEGGNHACAVSPTPLTINVSNPVPPGRVRVSFQDGVDSYAGTRDTTIDSANSTNNYGASNDIAAGDGWKSSLIKWNISAIPAGSIVNFVRLKLATTADPGTDLFYNVFRMKRSWVEGTQSGAGCTTGATWDKYDCASDWDTAGAEGTGDRYPQLVRMIAGLAANTTYSWLLNAHGVAAAQEWVNDSSSNHGIIIERRPDAADTIYFHSRESATSSLRPKLTIEYTPAVYFTVSSGTAISNLGSEVIIGTDTAGYGHMQLVALESQKVMAIYNDYAGAYNLRYRIFNGTTWESEQTIVTDCKDALTVLDANTYHYFSAVTDTNTAVHLIYVDSAGDPDIKYSSYTTAGGWSSPSLVQTGPVYDPTISHDLLYGNLYAFWVDGTTIKYSTKSAGGGSWNSAVTLRPNTYPPSYLSSASSDTTSIGVVWRGGNANAYEINYASVPLMRELAPPKPLTVTNVYTSSITATWDLVSAATGYTLVASTDPAMPPMVWASSTTDDVNVTTATVYSFLNALYMNTTYYLSVRASGGSKTSTWTVHPGTSTLADLVKDAQFFKVFGTSITVNWNALLPSPPVTSSATSEGYLIEVSSTNFGKSSPGGVTLSSSTLEVSLSTLTLQNLWDGTTYYFRVGALNWNNVPNFVFISSACTLPSTGDGTGFAAFDTASRAEQVITDSGDKTLTITGNGQKTLAAVSIIVPYTWDWTGLASDVTLSGEGITDPSDKWVTGLGTSGDPYVITLGTNTNATITNISTGVITISNLTAPGTVGTASANIFTVKTECTVELAEIVSSPGIAVYGTLTLGTDSTWNPSGEVLIGSEECLIAAFTLSANEEDVIVRNFTVEFAALGGAALGTEIISFRIYKESEDTANGWDDRGYPAGDDLVMASGAAEAITGTFEMYMVNTQNDSLTISESPHTYYLTVNVDAAYPEGTLQLQEGVKVDIAASTIIVSGAVSKWSFTNTGTFAGNNTILGGGVVQEAVLRLGLDRHTVYDGNEYWLFYIDDVEESRKAWYKTSPDGVDWTSSQVQVSDSATDLTSLGIWESSTTAHIYITYTDGTNSYIRKIQVSDKSLGTEHNITGMTIHGNTHSQIVISGGILLRKGEER